MRDVLEHFKLPLENPVLIFALVLFVILFGPLVLQRLRIPPIIGLLIAGALIGPHGFNLMLRDASIVLFGTVGLLYIMFLAGLEIDLEEFRKNRYRSLTFGLLTFCVPMAVGVLTSRRLLGYRLDSSILLASMYASHTLLAYPIASRFGVTKNSAVNITVGGTIITDTLALLVLAVIVGMTQGEIGQAFWIRLCLSLAVFAALVFGVVPHVARWFFKHEEDSISQFLFVLGAVFFTAFLAELAGVEPIIGAFAAGLALNRLIPRRSPLMSRVEFVGNALFIPFFLIGVGMLVDFQVFVKGFETIKVAAVMTVVATLCKLSAAWISKLAFRFTRDEFLMMFGLSNAQAAATLAAVMVGYRIELETLPDGTVVRLLNEDVLNGTIVMILVTCTISSFVTTRAASRLAVLEAAKDADDQAPDILRTMVALGPAESVERLVELATLMRPPKSSERLFALHVVAEDSSPEARARGRKLLDEAVKLAAASDHELEPISRHDVNVVSGLTHALKEYGVTDLVLGVTRESHEENPMFGQLGATVLERSNKAVFMYAPTQPLGTVRRIVVAAPARAEMEAGFVRWFERVRTLAKQAGMTLVFHAPAPTLAALRKLGEKAGLLAVEYRSFDDWDEFLILTSILRGDDLFVVVAARRRSLSYNQLFDKLPRQLARHFARNGYLVIFPEQLGEEFEEHGDLDPSMAEVLEGGVKRLDDAGRYMKRIFKRNE
ncbi:MAG: cation:proton antiporter [Planctomycetes bacterium]|nr:cation:proton antiporter [Planctomycetota bacterium]